MDSCRTRFVKFSSLPKGATAALFQDFVQDKFGLAYDGIMFDGSARSGLVVSSSLHVLPLIFVSSPFAGNALQPRQLRASTICLDRYGQ